MKTLLYAALIFVTIGSFSGCFVTSTANSFYKAPGFNAYGTFKIISVNTDDVLLGRLENQMLKQGFNLISDNYIRGAVPAGSTTVSTRDTTYQVPNSEMMAVRFADDKQADYVIKYQYSTLGINQVNFLNISVVNTKTGRTEVSFSFPEKAGDVPKVINVDNAFDLFISKLKWQ